MRKPSKRHPSQYRRYVIIAVMMTLSIGLLTIGQHVLTNNPHLIFRSQNILSPVSGELVFYGNVDGTSQIFHAYFHTAFDTIELTQLTDDDSRKSFHPLYSPDGQYIAYITAVSRNDDNGLTVQDVSLMLTNADTKVSNAIYNTTATSHQGIMWLSPDLVLIRLQHGLHYPETNWGQDCRYYEPYNLSFNIINIHTGEVQPLYTGAKNAGYLIDGNSECKSKLPQREDFQIPDELFPLDFVAPEHLWQAYVFRGTMVASHDRSHVVKSVVTLRGHLQGTFNGIYISDTDNQWELIEQVHAQHGMSWSPDDKYLVYKATHPTAGSAIAITSADGTFTYPLLEGHYGIPSWRPKK